MTSFVHIDYPKHHEGADRLVNAFDTAQGLRTKFSSSKAIATLLLSAMVAAAVVVAYEVASSMADGHLLVVWMAMWAAAFAALALLASPARGIAKSVKSALDQWSFEKAQARSDARLWAMAQQDGRLMNDLQCAMSHGQDLEMTSPVSAPAALVAARIQRKNADSLKAYQRSYI
jgi:hypothetical protein